MGRDSDKEEFCLFSISQTNLLYYHKSNNASPFQMIESILLSTISIIDYLEM